MTAPTPAQRRAWEEFLAGLPEMPERVARRLPPWRKYWLDPPGQVVTMYSYADDGTVTVIVDVGDNPSVGMSRRVFGVRPEHLHEYEEA